jgi:hypothetical protein
LLRFIVSCTNDAEVVDSLNQGLVACFPLDGNAFDTINQITATSKAVMPAPDRFNTAGKSLLFTAADSPVVDFGDCGEYSFPSNIFSISGWVYIEPGASNLAILSKRNETGPFEYSLDNHLNAPAFNLDNWVANGSTTVYGTDPLNAKVIVLTQHWQHLVYVADGSELRCYVNGIPYPETDLIKNGNLFSDTDASFRLGIGGGFAKNYFFNGCIDEVRIYNRTLSEDEIEALAEK